MIKQISLLVGAVMIVSGQLRAAVIPDVTIAAVSSEHATATDNRRATNLVNGVGLYGDIHTSHAPGSSWLSLPIAAGTHANEFVTFDLGASHTINRMKIWNYNEPHASSAAVLGRGMQSAHISYSTDNVTFTTNKPNLLLDKGPLAFTNFGQTIDMGGVEARYVRINVITNFGGDRVGLSKVLFYDNAVVPTVKLATHSFSGNRVSVQFTEQVQESSAENVANYTLQSGATMATISGAAVNLYNDTVTLTTSTLDSNLVYTLTVQNIRDASDTVTFSSAPVTVEKELTLWLKADQGVVADGSGFISQWSDQSGLGNHAIQPTNGVQPTLISGAVNGKETVHFDGVASLMEVPQSQSIQANRDISVFLVLNSENLTTIAQSPISKGPVNVPASFDIQIVRNTGKLSLVRGNGGGYNAFSSTAAIQPNEYYLVSVVMNETNATHYLNGSFNGTTTMPAGTADGGSPVRLGIRQDNGTKFTGNIAEVMMFRGAVSPLEKSGIDEYLGEKYGISVVALEITSHPENSTRYAGETASFGVAAVSGSPTLSYQWQKNNVNIPGATNATYTTPTLAVGDNGATYRVVVSTPLGITSTSTAATLTVLADTQLPTVLSAVQQEGSATAVIVTYSEAVGASATAAGNYSLNNGASVLSGVVGSSANQVILTTSTLDANATYLLSVQNVQDLAANTIAPSSTFILPANLAIWVRADSGVIANSGNLVSEWVDQSGNGNNALQYASPDRRPLLISDSINGKPALQFDGVGDYLEAAHNPSLAFSTNISIYVVGRIAPLAVNGYAHLIGKTMANLPGSIDYYVHNGANGMPLYRGNGTGYARVLATALPSFGETHVMNVNMNGTAVTHFLDGKPNGSGVLATNIADAGRPLRIGSRDSLDVFMNGEIAEVMIFNEAITDRQRRTIDSYLGSKYFPFSLQSPTNIAQLEGETATFTAVATAGPASFSYQWQKGTTDIPGATDSSYTTPTLTQADNGSTYRVIVTPLNGAPVISDAATLTVSADNELPTVDSVGQQVWDTNKIVVVFSEAVAPAGATVVGNYILDNGATVTSAVIGDEPNQVILTVTGLVTGTPYSLTVQNVQDLFNNTIVTVAVANGFHPASLAMWLKADAGVVVDGQNLVSNWADQSGNGNHAFPDAGSAPLFLPTTPGGQPGLSFDGTNQYLVVSHSDSIALTGDMTVYFVAQIKDFTSQAFEIGFIGKSGGAGNNYPMSFDYYLLKTSGLPRFYRGDGAVAGSVTATSAPSLGETHMFSVLMDGQNVSQSLDGLENGSGLITVPLADSGGPLGIGTRMDLRPKMNGTIQEILLFRSAVPASERAAVETYLGAKYGILIGAVPEISITQGVGSTFTLSWPTPSQTFVLQSTSDLGAEWTPASETVTNADGTSSVTINAATGSKFYRLQQP